MKLFKYPVVTECFLISPRWEVSGGVCQRVRREERWRPVLPGLFLAGRARSLLSGTNTLSTLHKTLPRSSNALEAAKPFCVPAVCHLFEDTIFTEDERGKLWKKKSGSLKSQLTQGGLSLPGQILKRLPANESQMRAPSKPLPWCVYMDQNYKCHLPVQAVSEGSTWQPGPGFRQGSVPTASRGSPSETSRSQLMWS